MDCAQLAGRLKRRYCPTTTPTNTDSGAWGLDNLCPAMAPATSPGPFHSSGHAAQFGLGTAQPDEVTLQDHITDRNQRAVPRRDHRRTDRHEKVIRMAHDRFAGVRSARAIALADEVDLANLVRKDVGGCGLLLAREALSASYDPSNITHVFCTPGSAFEVLRRFASREQDFVTACRAATP